MSVFLKEVFDTALLDKVKNGDGIIICPSDANIWRLEDILLSEGCGVLWGDKVLTPSNFIRRFAAPARPAINSIIEKAIVLEILQETELKYFNAVRGELQIGSEFHRAISTLRRNLIGSGLLEVELHERGSIKENDLLNIYKKYEERLARQGFSDEGDQLNYIIENTAVCGLPQTIIFSGFDIIPPGLSSFIRACNNVNIYIIQKQVPENPFYVKFQSLLKKGLSDIGIQALAPPIEEDEWVVDAEIELHTCRTAGDEARFIANTALQLISSGTKQREIGIAAPTNANTVELINNLMAAGLIPIEAVSSANGQLGLIRKIIIETDSIDELIEKADKQFSLKLATAIRNGEMSPQIPANLTDIKTVFDTVFLLENAGINNQNIHIYKNILLSSLSRKPDKTIINEELSIEWLWWGENVYPPVDTLFIPSFYQREVPPEGVPSLFFQELDFLPANAPLYFSILFPQREMQRARSAYQLRNYFQSARKRVVLSCPMVGPDGKEIYPSSISAAFNYKSFDEEEHPPFVFIEKLDEPEIKRRAVELIATAKRSAYKDKTSVIKDEEIKLDIKRRFEENIFSATQLEKYKRCSYQYFLDKVLKLEPLKIQTPEVDPKDRGIIIHYILELFYKKEMSNILAYMRGEIGFNQLEEHLDEYIDKAFNKHADLISKRDPSLIRYFKNRSRAVVLSAIQKEIKLISDMEYPLLPEFTEWEFGEGGIPPLIIERPPLEKKALIAGVADRIDVDEEHKTFTITDYKTGGTDAVIGKIRKGEHLQLPLYLIAVKTLLLKDKKPVGAFLFSLKDMEKKHGIARKEMRKFYFSSMNRKMFVRDDEWDELIEIAEQSAATYIQNIREAIFAEDESNCPALCDFKDICRYVKR